MADWPYTNLARIQDYPSCGEGKDRWRRGLWVAANGFLDGEAGQAGSCCLLDLMVAHGLAHEGELLGALPATKHVVV